MAGQLVAAGAVPAEIYAELYERETLGRLRLRGVVLTRVVTELDGRFAHTYILADDYEKTGALPTDTEDLINLAPRNRGDRICGHFDRTADGRIQSQFP